MGKNEIRLAVAAALLVHLPAARGQCWEQTLEVPSPSPTEFGDFGWSVALQGDLAVVSSESSVHLLQRDLGGPGAWGELKELFPKGAVVDGWGRSVDLDGDLVVVGHTYGFNGLGETYLFQRDLGGPDNWGLLTVLTAPDGQPGDQYGESVSVSGTTVAVGAPSASAPISEGGVYVYERDYGGAESWGQIAKIVPNHTLTQDFGVVAIDGDTLAITPRVGHTEVHERHAGGTENWGLTASIDEVLPRTVAIDGDTLAIGLPLQGVAGQSNAGLVMMYERNQGGANAWGKTNILQAPIPSKGQWFGTSIAIHGDRMIVGTYEDVPSVSVGAAYLHERDEGGPGAWGNVSRLAPPAPTGTDLFGHDVALDGDTALVGANSRDAGFPDVHGMAYIPTRGEILATTAYVTYSLLSVDPATGSATWIGSTYPNGIHGLAWDPVKGVLYGTDHDELYTVDPDTGVCTLIGPLNHDWTRGIAYDPASETLYGVDSSKRALLTIDTETGAATQIGPNGTMGNFNWVRSLTFDTTSGMLYAASQSTLELIVVDPVTGVGTAVGPFGGAPGLGEIEGLTIDSATGLMWGVDVELDEFLDIDVPTGAATSVAVMGTSNAGSVFFHQGSDFDNYCTAGFSASGCQALISAAGVPSATSASGFTLTTQNLEGSKNGFYVYGTNGRQANSWGSGTSFICIVPPRLRGGLREGNGTLGQCDGSITQDLNARWCPTCPKPLHNPGAGAVMQAQYWYRDPLNTSNQTSSFSDAIEFTFCP